MLSKSHIASSRRSAPAAFPRRPNPQSGNNVILPSEPKCQTKPTPARRHRSHRLPTSSFRIFNEPDGLYSVCYGGLSTAPEMNFDRAVARLIDHTILRPDAVRSDVRQVAQEALRL